MRERSSEDRRVVITRLSKEGLALVDSIDVPIEALISITNGQSSGVVALSGAIADLERVREAFE